MSTDKKYRLLKDLPNVESGEDFIKSKNGNTYFYGIPISSLIKENDQVGIVRFEAKHVEDNPEWFEEVKEPSIVPERIEVMARPYLCESERESDGSYARFTVQGPISNEQYRSVEVAIEKALNEDIVAESFNPFTIPRPAIKKTKSPFAEFQKNIESLSEKMYSKNEVDAMIEDKGLHYFREGYKYLRATNSKIVSYDELAEMTVVGAFKNLRRKEATLPLQQVPQDKPNWDDFINWTDKMQNEWFNSESSDVFEFVKEKLNKKQS